MVAPRVCVLRAPGTNCDVETAFAFDRCGGRSTRVHLFELIKSPAVLDEFQVLCVPGGFSYGDDIGAGVVLASQLRTRLRAALGRFLRGDKLVLGICNGFQALLKAGVLPNGAEDWPADDEPEADPGDGTNGLSTTLTWNENGRYTARWVRVKVASSNNVFLRGIDELDLPIAHAEGRLLPRDPQVLDRWQTRGQVALQYCANPHGPDAQRWPANPNGAFADIAGLGDASGRVLGLMPHPERFLFGTQHPQWTRTGRTGDGDGLRLFENAVQYFA